MRSRFTADQRAEICAFAVEHGPAAAGRQHGLNAKTVASWMHRAGMQTDAVMQATHIEKATEVARLSRAQRVATLADSLLARAESWLTRLGEVEVPITDAGEVKAIVTAAAIAIDKSQLLAGDPTSRSEISTPGEARERIAAMQAQWAERHRRVS